MPVNEELLKRDVAVIDVLDVGNGAASSAYSEAAHAYNLEGGGSVVERQFRTVFSGNIKDEATTFSRSEQFTAKSVEGEVLIVAKLDWCDRSKNFGETRFWRRNRFWGLFRVICTRILVHNTLNVPIDAHAAFVRCSN
jgi:hypothetical protein